MMNHDDATDSDRSEGTSYWRSIGGVAAAWVTRVEAERDEADRIDASDYIPVAWAAE